MTVNPSNLLEAYRTNFSLFAIKMFSIINPSQRFIPTGAFLTMAHALAELQAGRIKRLLITVPPRSGKSMLASVALPAFVLGRDPTKRVLCASYSGELAAKFARDCRSVMMHASYRQLFPATVIAGKNTESEIETAHGGFRFATSVGGTLTGRGGNYIVVDDPIKPEDAMSRAARDRSWEWFTGTLGSRLDNKAKDAIIVVMQRLHVDDLAGHLLEQGGWHHLSLPAIAEIEEELPAGWGRTFSRKIGDVLDPCREPLEILEQRGSRAICLVGRRSRKPENLTARPLGMRISRKLIESFASLRLAKLVNSRQSRLPCAIRAWPRSEATSKLKGNLLRGCGLPSATSVQEMVNCSTRRWSTSRCARKYEAIMKGWAFVRPSSKLTPMTF